MMFPHHTRNDKPCLISTTDGSLSSKLNALNKRTCFVRKAEAPFYGDNCSNSYSKHPIAPPAVAPLGRLGCPSAP